MRHRVLLVLLAAAVALQVFAQNEVGLTANTSKLGDAAFVDEGQSINLRFDEGFGGGVSFNHYFYPAFSLEVAALFFGADIELSVDDGQSLDAGELNGQAFTGMGQFHFNHAGRFSPYAGLGLAFVNGDIEIPEESQEDGVNAIGLDGKSTWVFGAGADVKMTEHVLINVDARYMSWTTKPDDGSIDEGIDIDPTIVSAGVKFRW